MLIYSYDISKEFLGEDLGNIMFVHQRFTEGNLHHPLECIFKVFGVDF
jgi:hypothetical protein